MLAETVISEGTTIQVGLVIGLIIAMTGLISSWSKAMSKLETLSTELAEVKTRQAEMYKWFLMSKGADRERLGSPLTSTTTIKGE